MYIFSYQYNHWRGIHRDRDRRANGSDHKQPLGTITCEHSYGYDDAQEDNIEQEG